ncbi:hypothetical protein DNTS_017741, partial [Danionella cerebrum]
ASLMLLSHLLMPRLFRYNTMRNTTPMRAKTMPRRTKDPTFLQSTFSSSVFLCALGCAHFRLLESAHCELFFSQSEKSLSLSQRQSNGFVPPAIQSILRTAAVYRLSGFSIPSVCGVQAVAG